MILVRSAVGGGGHLPQVNVPPARRHAQQTALERIRRLSCAGRDVAGFLDEVNPIVSQVVPNGATTITSPFWYTLDPGSHLVTSIYGQGCDVETSDYMRWELLAEDFIKTADVVQHPRGALTLHEVTDGHPERSQIYVEVMEPNGMAQELLVAIRSSAGENWGTTRLNRGPGEPMFTAHEIKFMMAASPLIADGVRRGLLVGEAIEPDRPDAPALIAMTSDGHVVSKSPGAEAWFVRLPDDDGKQDEVPTSVRAVAMSTWRDAERHGAGGASTIRVPMKGGGWAVVHGTTLRSDDDGLVTVIIEHAHPDRIAPLLMSIYGLTEREQELTQLVLRGGSTADIGKDLDVSPHTVQQHLKRIFDKTSVNSRGELVAKIYFDCYDPRARDNRARIKDGRSIRGGPKATR